MTEKTQMIRQEISFQLEGFYLNLITFAEQNDIDYTEVGNYLGEYGISSGDFLYEVEEWQS